MTCKTWKVPVALLLNAETGEITQVLLWHQAKEDVSSPWRNCIHLLEEKISTVVTANHRRSWPLNRVLHHPRIIKHYRELWRRLLGVEMIVE